MPIGLSLLIIHTKWPVMCGVGCWTSLISAMRYLFCSGYDIRTESGYDEMMHDLEQFIGLKYLKAVHVNDSRGNYCYNNFNTCFVFFFV